MREVAACGNRTSVHKSGWKNRNSNAASWSFCTRDGDTCTFMRPDTFEQIEVPGAILGSAKAFLQPGMEVPVGSLKVSPSA